MKYYLFKKWKDWYLYPVWQWEVPENMLRFEMRVLKDNFTFYHYWMSKRKVWYDEWKKDKKIFID